MDARYRADAALRLCRIRARHRSWRRPRDPGLARLETGPPASATASRRRAYRRRRTTPIRYWLARQGLPAERAPSSGGVPGLPVRCHAEPTGPCHAGRACVSGPPAGGVMEEDTRVTLTIRIPAFALAFMVTLPVTPIPGGPLALYPSGQMLACRVANCQSLEVHALPSARAGGLPSSGCQATLCMSSAARPHFDAQQLHVGQELPHLQVGSPGERGRGNG